MAAGRNPTVQAKAISMPTPAINPSSATPEKSVGTNARNPAAVARAATRIWSPACAAVARIAVGRSCVSCRLSR